ncbi:UNVERIFIED_CONTAM: Remorin [Sesamum radiatum]|uniref:Remorin n=1 Tax=Sesamum radiatum TaxID=300843 RepID=A0AAW2VLE5_SESRA
MAAAEAEQVVSKKPEAEEPPLAAVMEKPNVDKPVAPPPQDEGKALAIVPEPAEKKSSKGSLDRDVALAKLEDEKRLSFIKAWEESEKTKVENNMLSLETNIKLNSIHLQEELEKKKAEYAEKMKNKVALVHKQAEEKRAMVEARRGEEILKAEEMAAKYRATGQTPKKAFGCLGG